MILTKKRITKALISLRRCAGWSAPVLFSNPPKTGFLALLSIWITPFRQNSFSLLQGLHLNEVTRMMKIKRHYPVKLGYDIKRMASVKLAIGIISGDDIKKRQTEDFLQHMNMNWSLKETKLARVVLQ